MKDNCFHPELAEFHVANLPPHPPVSQLQLSALMAKFEHVGSLRIDSFSQVGKKMNGTYV